MAMSTEQMTKMLDDNMKAREHGRTLGSKLAAKFQKDSPNGTETCADMLAQMFFDFREEDHSMRMLLLDWTLERFYGLVIEQLLPNFDMMWKFLTEHKATTDNRLVWGDADDGAWVIPCEPEHYYETVKVIGHESYCTCRDENVIFFMKIESPVHTRLHTRNLLTTPKIRFDGKAEMPYKDCRDPGYIFSYEKMIRLDGERTTFPTVDRPLTFIKEVEYGIQVLGGFRYGVENPLDIPKKLTS
jgi:hypothetical protein